MVSDIGYVIIGGHRFDITRLSLGRSPEGLGSILFEFAVLGPLPAFEGPITIFAPDGSGICQGHTMSYPAIADELRWKTTYALTVANIDGPDQVTTFGP